MTNAIEEDVAFNFVPRAWRPSKPRKFGLTEIRAPHYWAYGTRHMQDVFDVADSLVFEWYIKNYGNEVNLFVDHSQILQCENFRQNIWGNKTTWGRIINPSPM